MSDVKASIVVFDAVVSFIKLTLLLEVTPPPIPGIPFLYPRP